MKRDESLVKLSREHHEALILSRLLRKDAPVYKGLPGDTGGKAEYAIRFYTEHLVQHFKNEEEVFELVKGIDGRINSLIDELVAEHHGFHSAFAEINNSAGLPAHLDKLGIRLETHIRKEERVLFPLIQDICNRDMLNLIGKYLSSH